MCLWIGNHIRNLKKMPPSLNYANLVGHLEFSLIFDVSKNLIYPFNFHQSDNGNAQ